MGMAVQMPALKKLGEELGLSMENGVGGVVNGALEPTPESGANAIEAAEDETARCSTKKKRAGISRPFFIRSRDRFSNRPMVNDVRGA